MSNSGKDVNSSTTFAFGDGTATATTSATARGTVVMAHDYEANVHYRYNFSNNWWLEPTAGASWVRDVESMGREDMNVWQVKAGTSAGTSIMWGHTKIEPGFTALAYSDVSVTGGAAKGGPQIMTDQGQLWGKGVAKLNYVWLRNFSSARPWPMEIAILKRAVLGAPAAKVGGSSGQSTTIHKIEKC
jgi:hypothetical protein